MNKNIRRTADLVAKLESGRDGLAALVGGAAPKSISESNPADLLDRLTDLIHEGQSHREFWVDATHGDYPRDAAAARHIKREWNSWTRSALSLWVLVERRRRLDNW